MSGRCVEVLLLTKNGQRYLDELLAAATDQLDAYGGRLLAIDSGSTDGTHAILRRHGVRVHQIAASEFQHGRTRNLAAGMTDRTTRYLVFLTQDATPREGWLAGLVDTMSASDDVAGAFSRQVPRHDANPLVARRMREEWPQVGGSVRVEKRLSDASTADPQRISHAQAHFANTSSCVRRKVWEKIPFPEVAFAEDVAWARRVLATGQTIVYEPSSSVWHSHSGSLWRTFAENVDHAGGVREVLAADGDTASWMPHRNGAVGRVSRDIRAIWRADRSLAGRLGWTAYAPLWYLAAAGGHWVGARDEPAFRRLRSRVSHQGAVARGARS